MIKNGIAHGTHFEVLGKIRQLCTNLGYCWADNRYIANEVGLSISRVSHVISDLYDAGLIERDITYKKGYDKPTVEKRLIRCVSKDARGIVNNSKEQNLSVTINIKRDSSEKVQAQQFGIKLGINLFLVAGMIGKYGAKYVLEKLNIVAQSMSCKNRTGLFVSACKKDYQPGKKALKANNTKTFEIPCRKSTNIAEVARPEIKAQTLTKDNEFVKELMSRFGGSPLGNKLSQLVNA